MIDKVTESPTKLKERAKALLVMLRKHSVSLDANGEVNYSQVGDEKVVKAL